jgi:hypothetical protein
MAYPLWGEPIPHRAGHILGSRHPLCHGIQKNYKSIS